jgi:hypothetical protein
VHFTLTNVFTACRKVCYNFFIRLSICEQKIKFCAAGISFLTFDVGNLLKFVCTIKFWLKLSISDGRFTWTTTSVRARISILTRADLTCSIFHRNNEYSQGYVTSSAPFKLKVFLVFLSLDRLSHTPPSLHLVLRGVGKEFCPFISGNLSSSSIVILCLLIHSPLLICWACQSLFLCSYRAFWLVNVY